MPVSLHGIEQQVILDSGAVINLLFPRLVVMLIVAAKSVLEKTTVANGARSKIFGSC